MTSPEQTGPDGTENISFSPQDVAFSPAWGTVVVDREEMSANSGRDTVFDWHVTDSGTLGAVRAAARDVADFRPFLAPGDRAVLDGPPDSDAWRAWALP